MAEGGTIFGNLGRNILRGPDQQDFDIAAIKTTPLTGRVNLIFRWEIFNALNRPNFAQPANDVSTPSTFWRDQRPNSESPNHAICAKGGILVCCVNCFGSQTRLFPGEGSASLSWYSRIYPGLKDQVAQDRSPFHQIGPELTGKIELDVNVQCLGNVNAAITLLGGVVQLTECRMAGTGVVPCVRAFLRLATQDLVDLYLQLGSSSFRITASVALMLPHRQERHQDSL